MVSYPIEKYFSGNSGNFEIISIAFKKKQYNISIWCALIF